MKVHVMKRTRGDSLRNLRLFLNSDRTPLEEILWRASGGADVIEFKSLTGKMAMITHGPLIDQILENPVFYRDSFAKIVAPWMGDGLAAAEGASWQRQRKSLRVVGQPPRFAHNIEPIYAIFDKALKAMKGKGEFDLYDLMGDVFYTISQQLVFGREIEGFVAVERMFEMVGKLVEMVTPRNPVKTIREFITYRNLKKKADKVLKREVEKRLTQRRKGAVNESSDYLDYILQMFEDDPELHEMMSAGGRDPVLDEIYMFIFGLRDTTSTGLTYALAFLEQAGRFEELDVEIATLGGAIPGIKDLRNLPYAEAAFRESLFQRPPAPLVLRKVKEDFVLEEHKFTKGMQVWVPYLLVQQNYLSSSPNPGFTPGRLIKGHPLYEEVPEGINHSFGGGRTYCIGALLAVAMGQLGIVAARRNGLKVTKIPTGLPPHWDVTLKPSQGIMARVG